MKITKDTKVADLKKELKARGLAVTGNKNELVERLQKALDSEGDTAEDMDSSDKTPAKKAAVKVNLSRNEPPPAPVSEKKSPKKPISAVSVSKADKKEQENIEPPKKMVKADDDAEKTPYEKRAERFGMPLTEEAKRLARAARFGESNVKGGSKLSAVNGSVDVTKLKARAERFGEVTAKSLSKAEELEKKKQRSERFAGSEDKKSDPSAIESAKAARAARFASDSTTEKKPGATKKTPIVAV